jgi:hypothetical protein
MVHALGRAERFEGRKGIGAMPPPRTGSVEPLKRADGRTYYRARIRLGEPSERALLYSR